ncbi:Protein of unknown function, partial [Gryllus bimaculatus]
AKRRHPSQRRGVSRI